MNAKEIDETLDALKRKDAKKLIEIAGMNAEEFNIEDPTREDVDRVLKAIMSKIEQGDYEYFSSKVNDVEYLSEYLDLLSYSTKIEDIKEVLDKRKELRISLRNLRKLIIATKEPWYIKEFLEDKEKIKEFRHSSYDFRKLILATNDFEYIQNIIKDETLRENRYELYGGELIELILETNNDEYIKQIIEDKEFRTDKLNLQPYHVAKLIIGTKQPGYIKNIIDDEDFVKDFNFDGNDIVDLIIATGDMDYIKKMLKEKTKLEDEFGLNEFEIDRLVLETEDSKGKEKFLRKKENEYEGESIESKIKLPENMTIGMEIESEGVVSREILELSDIISLGWKCKGDASIKEGVEVISPILRGNTNETTEQIKKVCTRLEMLRTICNIYVWWTYSYWS